MTRIFESPACLVLNTPVFDLPCVASQNAPHIGINATQISIDLYSNFWPHKHNIVKFNKKSSEWSFCQILLYKFWKELSHSLTHVQTQFRQLLQLNTSSEAYPVGFSKLWLLPLCIKTRVMTLKWQRSGLVCGQGTRLLDNFIISDCSNINTVHNIPYLRTSS